MTGFVATADATDTTITNDGWWPDVDTAAVRDIQRIDGTVTAARLREALVTAIVSVNAELLAWRTTQEVTLAYAELADVPAPKIDNISQLVHLYQRAVRCTAHAYLVERYRNLDITDKGQKVADEQTPSIDELRRDARWAIADIQGLTHATVELI